MTALRLSLKDVIVKRQGNVILGPLSVTLGPSGITLVLGPNGSGKTTLLKAMHGIERLTSGTLAWSEPDAVARPAQAYVFQRPIMLRRSVAENLAYPLRLLNRNAGDINTRVRDMATAIGLADALPLPAPRLSGGEQQKLALGRALIRDPQVLFLDEPCANLDGGATGEIEALLKAANAMGTRIIMSTHDLGQARRLATDTLFLLNGQLHEQASAEKFFTAPKTDAARAFLRGDIVE